MKTIKKLKDNIGKVAGSALLVGATLTAGAAAVSAQDNGSSGDLGDYPAPFVNEDGEVDTTVVVGETAEDGNPVSTADVVSAVEIAGSLGAAAFTEEEVNVDVETTGAVAGWSATNGVTLDRRNSPIFFGQDIDSEENRLDDQDLDVLAETTFQSEDNEDVDVEHDVRVGTQSQRFDSDRGDVDDPVLHVTNPTSPSVSSETYLMQAEVEFSDTIDFVEAGTDDSSPADGADEYIEDGETIDMFGQDFEFSDESTTDELVFYGSSESFTIGTNEEAETVTVDGEDHEFDVSYVPSSESEDATVTVDGDTQGVAVGDTINFGDTEVRVTDFYKRSGEEGLGSVEFSIGSDEVTIGNSGDVEVGGETLDRVDANVVTDDDFETVDGIEFAFGAEDSDENMVAAGETYEDPLFGLQFHYGGLSGDVVENPADVFEVDAEDDDNVDFTFTAGGEETTLQLGEVDGSSFSFGPDTDETIAQYEGQEITEDDYTVLNANEEADMYQVVNVDDTDVDDASGGSSGANDESVTVELENVVTGETVEVEEDGLDLTNGGDDWSDDSETEVTLTGESIEGKDYDVTFYGGDTVSFERTSGDTGTQLWPHMYSDTDAAFAIDAPTEVDLTNVFTVSDGDFDSEGQSLDSSVASDGASSTDADEVSVEATVTGDTPTQGTVRLYDSSGEVGTVPVADAIGGQNNVALSSTTTVTRVELTGTDGGAGDVTVTVDSDDESSSGDTGSATVSPVATREAGIPSGVASNDATATVTYTDEEVVSDVSPDQAFVQYDISVGSNDDVDLAGRTTGDNQAAVLALQPEDDNDDENGYVIEAYADDGGQDVSRTYLGDAADYQTADMDDEDINAGYDFYGAYSMLDEEDSDTDVFTLHLPAGQSSAGLAVTGAEGSLSADGGSSSASGSAMSESATGSYADVALDNELEGSDRTASNLILVGGPSVNSLVGELVDENQTMPASDYTEGEGMVQMVDGFGDHSALVVAGHSGEDTRAAGEFLADYRNNQEAMAGQSQVTVSTETGQVVE
ncbi:hypothetical protein HRED_00231 [Candidatus Haloredivivus sp. G17]|nr:hypothetical protein HRED_00231 [Candidatus Haloredivivus sp. G17]